MPWHVVRTWCRGTGKDECVFFWATHANTIYICTDHDLVVDMMPHSSNHQVLLEGAGFQLYGRVKLELHRPVTSFPCDRTHSRVPRVDKIRLSLVLALQQLLCIKCTCSLPTHPLDLPANTLAPPQMHVLCSKYTSLTLEDCMMRLGRKCICCRTSEVVVMCLL
jgi:hypothetical protein